MRAGALACRREAPDSPSRLAADQSLEPTTALEGNGEVGRSRLSCDTTKLSS